MGLGAQRTKASHEEVHGGILLFVGSFTASFCSLPPVVQLAGAEVHRV